MRPDLDGGFPMVAYIFDGILQRDVPAERYLGVRLDRPRVEAVRHLRFAIVHLSRNRFSLLHDGETVFVALFHHSRYEMLHELILFRRLRERVTLFLQVSDVAAGV